MKILTITNPHSVDIKLGKYYRCWLISFCLHSICLLNVNNVFLICSYLLSLLQHVYCTFSHHKDDKDTICWLTFGFLLRYYIFWVNWSLNMINTTQGFGQTVNAKRKHESSKVQHTKHERDQICSLHSSYLEEGWRKQMDVWENLQEVKCVTAITVWTSAVTTAAQTALQSFKHQYSG